MAQRNIASRKRPEELKGRKFGTWTVLRLAPYERNKGVKWHCRCDCGAERIIYVKSLKSGHTQNCGCRGLTGGKPSQLLGQRFGRLVVMECLGLRQHSTGRNAMWWRCKCDCGNEIEARTGSLSTGSAQSCGCKRRDALSRHGKASTRTYRIWASMKVRSDSTRKGQPKYLNYAGRGIGRCERWVSFENFFADMGEAPAGKTLDRINPNADYSPENCRWATPTQQQRNRRNTRLVRYEGEVMTITEAITRLRRSSWLLHKPA